MALKLRVNRIMPRLKELWAVKLFRFAIIINSIYLIISIVMTIFSESADFEVYYNVGKIFLSNIGDLYNPLNYPPDLPFRYFPLSALFFIPYSFLDLKFAAIIFNLVNFFLNVLISIVIYKTLILFRDNHMSEKDEERAIKYISLFLMGFPQISNYVLGQINLYCCLFILLSLYVFLKYSSLKWDFIGSIILGISILIKPIAILMIPFLVAIRYDFVAKKISFELKRSIVRVSGILLPLIINIIPFLLYPSLIQGFIALNLTSEYTVTLNFSISLTKNITNFCIFYGIPFNQEILFFGLLLFFGVSAIIAIMFKENKQNAFIINYIFGILVMFITYFDTWDHHLLILTPLLLILIFYLPQDSKIAKIYINPGFYVLNFLNLIFIGLWVILMTIFPFNFVGTVFLIVIFFGISKHCINNRNIIDKG